jgi:hypothetical protein
VGWVRPKGPSARRRAAKRRKEGDHASVVRDQDVERDGHCRLAGVAVPCDGPSEWAHLEGQKRFETRGMSPERRHTTAGTCMMCRRHHAIYDKRRELDLELRIQSVNESRGADGTLQVGWLNPVSHAREYVYV